MALKSVLVQFLICYSIYIDENFTHSINFLLMIMISQYNKNIIYDLVLS